MPYLDADSVVSAPALARVAAAARLVACFAALPLMLQVAAGPMLALPLLFAAYGGILYWHAVARPGGRERPFIHWLDALWFLALIIATGGPGSPFALFLLFPILFVSFRRGFASGMAMALSAALVLPVLEWPTARQGARELLAALAPSAALLVLGYLIAGWAASGLALNRRLVLLRGLGAEFSPRLAPEQLVDAAVRRLAPPYPIDRYWLLDGAMLWEAQLPGALRPAPPDMANEWGPQLQSLDLPLAWCGGRGLRRSRLFGASPLDARLLRRHGETARRVAGMLDCRSFCAVAIPLRDGATVRLFLASRQGRFTADDLRFFQQLGQQLGPRLASASLLDQLADQVADYERQKISRDLHDSAIQPYIGLKFALEALARKVPATDPVGRELAKLVEMASMEISELRRYVKGLRREGEPGNAALVPAVRRQAARFGDLYGIQVTVQAPEGLSIGDHLADQAFHMIGEALSNVRRHTEASRARIELSCDGRRFRFCVANPADGNRSPCFVPRSITERARSLGGRCRVGQGTGGETEVVVELPLDGLPGQEREACAA